ncbi:MAG: 3'-5' exonuclease [Gammaproteobacteria bacterium]|nr:3'-5' exonuclease [Gammaproteobacteria bacterium]
MNVLCFDIETIPDVEYGRRLFELGDLDDESVAKVMQFKQVQARQTNFLPLPQHRVVVISAVLRNSDGLHFFSLGEDLGSEREIVQRFFDGLERKSPDLVSWNGSGFDLPVLHYRALLHGVNAARYWDTGDGDREFRFNNYLSRFHWRHIDLMDVLSGFQLGGRASLQATAVLLGLPGKLGMSGAKVWDYYLEGKRVEIERYCETDALNTYLVYLRFELMRGNLDRTAYEAEVARVRDKLARSDAPHWQEFLAAWPDGDPR